MISTTFIHFHTAFLPAYFVGAAFLFHYSGRLTGKRILKNISYWLFVFTGFVTTIACAFGGASMRKAEASGGVDLSVLKTHSWTAMLVFLVSVLMAYFSVKLLRNKSDERKTDALLIFLSSLFMILFIITTLLAYRIRF